MIYLPESKLVRTNSPFGLVIVPVTKIESGIL